MRAYRPPIPRTWWLRHPAYVRFVLRELTSVLIAAYVILLLVLIRRIAAGPAAFADHLRWLASPPLVGFHLVALAAAVYHTLTWLSLAPMAVPLHLRGRRVRPGTIVAASVAVWLVISAVIGWLVLRG